MSAQRYPEDFDGIIAGAPAYDQIYISAWRMRLWMAALKSPQHALPPEKLKLLNDAVLDKCDGNDGVKDRLIENPRNCNFDPSVLKCNGTGTASCLTPQQLETVNTAYSDLRSSTGELLYPHLPFGRTRLAPSCRCHRARGYGHRHLPLYCQPRPRMGLAQFRPRKRHRPSTSARARNTRRQPGLGKIQSTQRQAPDVSRLERRRFRRLDLRSEYHLVLRVRPEADGPEPGGLVSSFSGAWDGSLRGRDRPQSVQQDRCARTPSAYLLQDTASESESHKLSNADVLDSSDQSFAGSRKTRVFCLFPRLLVLHGYIHE
jgi:Tannase and feruloyl esterase